MNHESFPSKEPENSTENPWANFSTRELPTTSPNRICGFYIREVNRLGKLDELAHFIDGELEKTPKVYTSPEDFCADNPDYIEDVNTLSYNQKSAIKEYSGFRFAWINSYLRGFWDYDKMGRKTPEAEDEIKTTAAEISTAISKAPAPQTDFVTFRGANLDGFRGYNIQSLEDLKTLEGQFHLEEGFTSTAISKDKSFIERKVSSDLWIDESNIEVIYRIPAGSHDSIALLTNELSYNPEQTEVLLNRNSLSYIHKVSVENGRATIHALLIPREFYEPKPES